MQTLPMSSITKQNDIFNKIWLLLINTWNRIYMLPYNIRLQILNRMLIIKIFLIPK